MTVDRVVVVIRTVEVGRHDRNIIRAVLTVQELAVFQTGDFCQRIGFIGLFQFGSQQAVLFHRLRSHTGINAGRTEELQLLASILPCRVNGIHLQCRIIIHGVCQCFLIGDDATNFCCRKEHILRLFLCKECFNSVLTSQVKFPVCTSDNIGISLTLQLADNRRTYHSEMTCNIDFCIFLHHNYSASRIAFSRFASLRSCFAMISTSCS